MRLAGYRLQSTTNRDLYLVHTGTRANPKTDWTSDLKVAHLFIEQGEAEITRASLLTAGMVVRIVPVYEPEGHYAGLITDPNFIPEGA